MAYGEGVRPARPRDLVRPEILSLQAYHVAPAQGMVKLDAMENPYRLPPAVAAEMGERLAQVAINRYPDPTAAKLKAVLRDAMDVPADLELVLGNGSDELLQMLSLLVARPGASVVAPEPSFVMYRMGAIVAGLRYVGVSLRADFSLDADALIDAIAREKPAITWIAYPNNPSGTLFPREAILEAARASPGLVVVDEAYYPFSGGASLLRDVPQLPNLILVRTVSKLGLAGLRVGVAIGAPEWMSELEKLRPPYNVNSLSMCAAEFLLARDDVLEAQTRAIVRERAALERGLDAIFGLERFPSAANFVLVRVPDGPGAYEALKQRGILVRTFHGSHPLLANCLRLTVGTAEENARLLEALASILQPHHA
jgi:histidinol-phosphate aminotransferase